MIGIKTLLLHKKILQDFFKTCVTSRLDVPVYPSKNYSKTPTPPIKIHLIILRQRCLYHLSFS